MFHKTSHLNGWKRQLEKISGRVTIIFCTRYLSGRWGRKARQRTRKKTCSRPPKNPQKDPDLTHGEAWCCQHDAVELLLFIWRRVCGRVSFQISSCFGTKLAASEEKCHRAAQHRPKAPIQVDGRAALEDDQHFETAQSDPIEKPKPIDKLRKKPVQRFRVNLHRRIPSVFTRKRRMKLLSHDVLRLNDVLQATESCFVF